MTKSKTRLDRLKSRPTDLRWNEFVATLGDFGFEWKQNAGGSSHGHFYNPATKRKFSVTKPHSPSIMKRYVINDALKMLDDDDGLI